MIHRTLVIFAALAALALGGPAGADGADAAAGADGADGAKLWQTRTCIACHGPDAKTPILPEYPRLAGQNAPYLLRQMKDIKSGARNNGNTPAMAGVMHLVNEEEMAVLADYISKLEP